MKTLFPWFCLYLAGLSSTYVAHAGVEGSISGTVTDSQGVVFSNTPIQLKTQEGKVVKEGVSSATGEFQFFPVQFGDYQMSVRSRASLLIRRSCT